MGGGGVCQKIMLDYKGGRGGLGDPQNGLRNCWMFPNAIYLNLPNNCTGHNKSPYLYWNGNLSNLGPTKLIFDIKVILSMKCEL